MVSEREWEELIGKIYNLVGLEGLLDLEMIIPSNLFFEAQDKEEIYALSIYYIKLTACSNCTGKDLSNTIKIKFGPIENVDLNNKEIIIDFKYSRQIVSKLIEYLQPLKLEIRTENLIERKTIFSEPISTLQKEKKL